jgi:undecaprenyl-diphosphatase
MQFDTQVFYFFNNFTGKSYFLDTVILFCGSYLAYVLGAMFLLFLYYRVQTSWRKRIEVFSGALIAVALSRGVITETIRHFLHRERPFVALGLTKAHTLITDSSWSFPSGHATFFFALSTVVYLYDKRWGAFFFVATVLIVLGRVAGGAHYPSDILAGLIIGVFTGYFTVRCARYFLPKIIQKEY